MNEKIKTIKIVTVSLLVVIVLLLAAMLINFISLAKANSRKKALEAQLQQLIERSATYEDEIEYKENDEYIEKTARELGMKREGEKVAKGKGS